MSATYASNLKCETDVDLSQEIEALIKKSPRAWQSVFAMLGLAGGLIAPVLGAMADVITWFINSRPINSYLHVASIVLCALTLPLVMLGAFCLDSLKAKTPNLPRP